MESAINCIFCKCMEKHIFIKGNWQICPSTKETAISTFVVDFCKNFHDTKFPKKIVDSLKIPVSRESFRESSFIFQRFSKCMEFRMVQEAIDTLENCFARAQEAEWNVSWPSHLYLLTISIFLNVWTLEWTAIRLNVASPIVTEFRQLMEFSHYLTSWAHTLERRVSSFVTSHSCNYLGINTSIGISTPKLFQRNLSILRSDTLFEFHSKLSGVTAGYYTEGFSTSFIISFMRRFYRVIVFLNTMIFLTSHFPWIQAWKPKEKFQTTIRKWKIYFDPFSSLDTAENIVSTNK